MKSYYRPDYEPHQAPYRRAQRRHRALRAAKAGVLLGIVAGLLGLLTAAWVALGPGWLRSRVASLRLFSAESVLVSGNRTLGAEAILGIAGLARGESLLGLDLAAARARLVSHPRVREASLRRRLPSTLVIEVRERVPFVVVRSDQDYLVDREGAVVAVLPPGAPTALPVLVGVGTAGGALTGRGGEDVVAGIELIAAIREIGFPALEAIAHIDLGDPEDAVLVPVAGRPLVHAGRGGAAVRLRRWKLVAPDMAARWPELEYVDLRPEGQVVAMPAGPPAKDGVEKVKSPEAQDGAAHGAPGGKDA